VCLVSFFGVSTAPASQPPAAEAKPPQRTIKFEFRDQPWDRVLEFFATESNLEWVGPTKPPGTFSFSGGNKKYTIPQAVDIINDALVQIDYILIRKGQGQFLTAHAKDPKAIDTTLIPVITADELDVDKPEDQQRIGRTELRRVFFQLRSLTKEQAEKDVGQLLSPFGKIAGITANNKLMVTDMAGVLRSAKKLLDEIDAPTGGEFDVIALGALDPDFVEKTVGAAFGRTADGKYPSNAP